MSGKTGAPSSGAPPSSAADGPGGPIQGIKQAHVSSVTGVNAFFLTATCLQADLVAWCYKPHGAVTDEQLRKVDAAGVKREHVRGEIAYGLIGLTSLYLMTGEEAMFVSNLITFLYPAAVSVDVIRHKKSGEAIGQLLYWVPFGFFALLDSTSFSLIPAYFLLRVSLPPLPIQFNFSMVLCFLREQLFQTALLVFLFLPQTQGAQLIFTKVIEPIAKAVEGFAKKA
ncbi:TB2/DP1, HVA22 family [Ancylostoma duodenale]|uniref:TB2/DP1, HVA22 family n=1 Tax=Ancylostoma duodenale TaxID=51022 RepID=A0A0C2DPY5_9BILA|nr:TB2/DP1, HVA22 family [Ancylostoma duodenale]